jgi:hypothetical protein
MPKHGQKPGGNMREEKDGRIYKATHEGVLKIGAQMIPCAVLENGCRVLSYHQTVLALGRTVGGGTGYANSKKDKKNDLVNTPYFLASRRLKPFISKQLSIRSKKVEKYIQKHGGIAHGIKAELLPAICEVWLRARDANALHYKQIQIAKQAEIIIRGLAHVGIIALIDESTGYQETRGRRALSRILEAYLTDQWSAWSKTFPDEFYEELFRLRGETCLLETSHKPSYIGHLTNEIVYSRLAPGVLQELSKLNPRNRNGHRSRKYHQHLTKNFGYCRLKEHLAQVIFLMRSCATWKEFTLRLNWAAPKYGATIEMKLPDQSCRPPLFQ